MHVHEGSSASLPCIVAEVTPSIGMGVLLCPLAVGHMTSKTTNDVFCFIAILRDFFSLIKDIKQ
jgi:hypothetical protein